MDHDIIIVGAGPAGLSTGLHLAQLAPELAERTLILERARHPRPKLCAGGITPGGEAWLRKLALDLSQVTSVDVRARLRYTKSTLTTGHFFERCHSGLRMARRATLNVRNLLALWCIIGVFRQPRPSSPLVRMCPFASLVPIIGGLDIGGHRTPFSRIHMQRIIGSEHPIQEQEVFAWLSARSHL